MQIPEGFQWVLATGLAINFHAFLQAEAVAFGRAKFFPKEFMEKEFGQVHHEQLGEDIQGGGYPDTGSGLYSHKLSYKDWYRFNVLQRCHLNYLENLPIVLTSLVAAGLYDPKKASIVGAAYLIFRILYCRFYKEKGGAMNKLRQVGAIGGFACILANIGIFAYNFYKSKNA